MDYPQIREYIDAISIPENFDKHTDLTLEKRGRLPVMSSGKFAVVFKMTDGERSYAVKCFIKEQPGRAEAYRKICGYLGHVRSPYLLRTEYLERELYVNGEEYPVLLMEWAEGETLENYMEKVKGDKAARERLADEFRGLAQWLLGQEFSHGDVKPDNIMVRSDGSLVLVDYDGMYVPSMRGERARELGTPPYRSRVRTESDFDEYGDDYALAFIMLVLSANVYEPQEFGRFGTMGVSETVAYFAKYGEHRQVAPSLSALLLAASSGRIDRQAAWPLLSYRGAAVPASTGRSAESACVADRRAKSEPGQAVKNDEGQSAGQGAQRAASQPRTFTVNGVDFEMAPVEGGTFTMGATKEQGSDAWNDEKPAHEVTVSGFAIGKYPVTQALWRAVMGNNPSEFSGDGNPVECVSWNDCQEFIEKLNGRLNLPDASGREFRLPTEAEWEYAARGGNRSKGYKYSGSDNLGEVAWYDGNSGGKTHPVGQKKGNELGICDMSGNVWEWCGDWYGAYPSVAQRDPQGPSSGSDRVLRGGSWDNFARNCRVSRRIDFDPDSGDYNFGFRLVLA